MGAGQKVRSYDPAPHDSLALNEDLNDMWTQYRENPPSSLEEDEGKDQVEQEENPLETITQCHVDEDPLLEAAENDDSEPEDEIGRDFEDEDLYLDAKEASKNMAVKKPLEFVSPPHYSKELGGLEPENQDSEFLATYNPEIDKWAGNEKREYKFQRKSKSVKEFLACDDNGRQLVCSISGEYDSTSKESTPENSSVSLGEKAANRTARKYFPDAKVNSTVYQEAVASLATPFERCADTRFFVGEMQVGSWHMPGLVDGGSQACLIPRHLLDKAIPNWRKILKGADGIKLTTHTATKINIVSRRWIPFKLNGSCKWMVWRFYVEETERTEILIGSDLIRRFGLNMLQMEDGRYYLSVPPRFRKGFNENQDDEAKSPCLMLSLEDEERSKLLPSYNVESIMFRRRGRKICKFEVPPEVSDNQKVLVTQKYYDEDEPVTIAPSLSRVYQSKGRRYVAALTINRDNRNRRVAARKLEVDLEPFDDDDHKEISLIGSGEDVDELKESLESGELAVVREALPRRPSTSHMVSEIRKDKRNPSSEVVPEAVDSGVAEKALKGNKGKEKSFKYIDMLKDDVFDGHVDPVVYEKVEKLDAEFEDQAFATSHALDCSPSAMIGWDDPISMVPLDQVPQEYHPRIKKFLKKYEALLARSEFDAGDCSSKMKAYFYLPLHSKMPKGRKVFHGGPEQMGQLQDILQHMMAWKLIEPCISYSGEPVFLLAKKNPSKSCRFIVSLTALNESLCDFNSVLPKMSTLIERVAQVGDTKGSFITTLDLASGFYSVKIAKEHRNRLILLTSFGSFRMLALPMGCKTAPQVFEALVSQALARDPETGDISPIPGVVSYLDDISCASQRTGDDEADFLRHLELLDRVFARLLACGFKLNPSKILIFTTKAKLLGHVINGDKITVDEDRFKKINEMTSPTTKRQLQKYMGFLVSIKHFTPPEMAICRAAMTELLEGNRKFRWEDRHELAFQKSKEILMGNDFCVYAPDPEKCKLLMVDASLLFSGAILFDVDFHMEVVQKEELFKGYPIAKSDPMWPTIKHNRLEGAVAFSNHTPPDGDCFLHALMDQTKILGMPSLAKNTKELRCVLLNQLRLSPEKNEICQTLKSFGLDFEVEFDKLKKDKAPINELLWLPAARAARRNIIILHNVEKKDAPNPTFETRDAILVQAGRNADLKPPMILAFYDTCHNATYSTNSLGFNSHPLGGATVLGSQEQQEGSSGKSKVKIQTHSIANSMVKSSIVTSSQGSKKSGCGHYQSLVLLKPTELSKYTSNHIVQFDHHEMTRKEIFDTVKQLIKPNNGPSKHTIRPIAYDSQVVKREDRDKSIYQLELASMVTALHKFKQYTRSAPALICVTDSSVAMYLTDPAVNISKVKVRRINILLAQEYPNLMLHLVPSSQNYSDFFSRFQILDKVAKKAVRFKDYRAMRFPTDTEHTLTIQDLQKLAVRYRDLTEEEVEKEKVSKDKNELDREKKTPREVHYVQAIGKESKAAFNSITAALKVLRERLTKDKFIAAQKDEIPEFDHSSQMSGKFKNPHLSVEDGYLKYDGKIFVPPSMENVLISHAHLVYGHCGSARLWDALKREYYIPHGWRKISSFTRMCLSCQIANPLVNKKLSMGAYPQPTRAFQTLHIDFLENIPGNHRKFLSYLVIVDGLTKAFYIFPVRNQTTEAVLDHFKIFLMMTNFQTETIVSDNAKIFRSGRFLEFMSALGIQVPLTVARHPESRGIAERTILKVKLYLQKLLLQQKNYDSAELYFMLPLMHNNAPHEALKTAPNSLIYGNTSNMLGQLEIDPGGIETKGQLLTENLKQNARELRKQIDENIAKARKAMNDAIERRDKKHNADGRAEKHGLTIGSLVFLKNLNPPTAGANPKFRPTMHQSPFIVTKVGSKQVHIKRLADNFETYYHADDCRKFVTGDPQFDSLPKEVLDIIGKPLTEASIIALARIDKLEHIFVKEQVPAGQHRTRTQTRRTKDDEEEEDKKNDSEDDDDDDPVDNGRRVTFAV